MCVRDMSAWYNFRYNLKFLNFFLSAKMNLSFISQQFALQITKGNPLFS